MGSFTTLYTQTGVPVLDVADKSKQEIAATHQAYVETGDAAHLRAGERVWVDNPSPRGDGAGAVTDFTIGGETLDEALKSVIAALEQHHASEGPRWVSSTDDKLAQYLAEHYDCQVIPVLEVAKKG